MWIIIDYMFELNTKIQAKYHKITNKLLKKKTLRNKKYQDAQMSSNCRVLCAIRMRLWKRRHFMIIKRGILLLTGLCGAMINEIRAAWNLIFVQNDSLYNDIRA